MSQVAVSYARFSSVGQAKGDSLRRQVENAERYAAENGLIIDKRWSFRDLGVSAYDQSNIRKGALGLFLKAVETGKIPAGTVLIVESFDRLSRAEPLDALGVFTDIINAGITVVTLTDKKVFSREIIKNDSMLLLTSILAMQLAFNESRQKSQRLKTNWVKKHADALASGKVMTTRTPLWIGVVVEGPGRRFELIADRAAIVKQVVDLAISGTGNTTLTRTLNAQGTKGWTQQGWTHSVLQRMLTNPALYGAIHIGDELHEGYYPAVIDKPTFLLLQDKRAKRATGRTISRKGQHVTNLFSGRLRCGYCGETMGVMAQIVLKDSQAKRKYVACSGARSGQTSCKRVYWAIDELEPKILLWLLNVNYQSLFGTQQDDLTKRQKLLAETQDRLAKVRKQIARIVKFIYDGEGETPRALRQQLDQFEAEDQALTKDVASQAGAVASVQVQESSSQGRMTGLLATFKAMNAAERTRTSTGDNLPLRTIREQLSAAIAEVLESVTMYPTGPTTSGDKTQRYMDIKLKNGQTYTVEDFDTPQDDHDEVEVLRTAHLELLQRFIDQSGGTH